MVQIGDSFVINKSCEMKARIFWMIKEINDKKEVLVLKFDKESSHISKYNDMATLEKQLKYWDCEPCSPEEFQEGLRFMIISIFNVRI